LALRCLSHRSSTRRRSAALSLQRLHLHHILRPRDHRHANKVDLRTRPSPSSRVHRPLHRLTQDHRRRTSRPWHRPSPHHRRSQLGRSLSHVVVVHHMGRATHRHRHLLGRTTHRHRRRRRPSPIASKGIAHFQHPTTCRTSGGTTFQSGQCTWYHGTDVVRAHA
jgi:hypothetical protein